MKQLTLGAVIVLAALIPWRVSQVAAADAHDGHGHAPSSKGKAAETAKEGVAPEKTEAHSAGDGHGHAPAAQGKTEEAAKKDDASAEEGKHGEDDGHGHAPAPTSVEDVLKLQCEHKIPTYTCAECRYETGVVKLEPNLMKKDGSAGGAIRAQVITKRKMVSAAEVTGEIQWNEKTTVHVSPRVSGVIQSVEVDLNTKVKKGDTLFVIESGELGQALVEYQKSRTIAELARKTFDREKSLFEKKAGAEMDMIQAQIELEQKQADLDAARHRLRVLGMADAEIVTLKPEDRALTGRLSLRAPVDGWIVDKHAAIGEMVESGKDVMLLADPSTLWAWLDIYERDLAVLLEQSAKGKVPVSIRVKAFPGREFQGVIDTVGASMNEETRTVKVRAAVENPELLLRSGMFCQARIAMGGETEALALPRAAVLEDEGKAFVFRHIKDDYYIRSAVTKGRSFADAIEILEGLKPGDTVVTEGAFMLKSDILREKMGAGCAD